MNMEAIAWRDGERAVKTTPTGVVVATYQSAA
jgi:hypothetical protein